MFKLSLALICCCAVIIHAGETIHVGTDQAIRDLGALRNELDKRTDVSEVIIHEGVYFGGLSITPLNETSPRESTLLLHAASGEKVIFEGSRPLGDMTPVDGVANVYSMPAGSLQVSLLKLWDANNRTRYKRAADRTAVAHFPATFTIDEKVLYVHIPDGVNPASLHRSHLDFGVYCTRSNVTIRGIHFRGYLLRDKWSNGIDVRGDNITVEDCISENTSLGFIVSGDNCVVRNCATSDVGGGIYVKGKNALIENCRLYKVRDHFMVPMYEQDDTGIQFYYPATGGTVRGNLCVGFNRGIFIKAPPAPYAVEHNTVDGRGQGTGFGATQWHQDATFTYNLIANVAAAWTLPAKANPSQLTHNFYSVAKHSTDAPLGNALITGDPKFIAPSWGDYRLANDSPVLQLMDEGKPAGAFEAIGTASLMAQDEAPRTWHVAMKGRDGHDGSELEPWRTIQHAVNMARPGDTVLIHPGIYEDPLVIRRGGLEGHPIKIRAAKKWTVILDSLREDAVAVHVDNAPYVELHDLEIRWYGRIAVKVQESPHVAIVGCRIWNAHWGGAWPTGTAVRVMHSPHFTAHHNVLFRQEHGVWIYSSPQCVIRHNTAVGNLYAGIALLYSSQGSTIQDNILAWNGNDSLVIHEHLGKVDQLKHLICNRNVYVTQLRRASMDSDAAAQSQAPPMPELSSDSKAIFNYTEFKGDTRRFRSLKSWHETTGLDAESVFVDPQFVDPKQRDFCLQPDSPAAGVGALP